MAHSRTRKRTTKPSPTTAQLLQQALALARRAQLRARRAMKRANEAEEEAAHAMRRMADERRLTDITRAAAIKYKESAEVAQRELEASRARSIQMSTQLAEILSSMPLEKAKRWLIGGVDINVLAPRGVQ